MYVSYYLPPPQSQWPIQQYFSVVWNIGLLRNIKNNLCIISAVPILFGPFTQIQGSTDDAQIHIKTKTFSKKIPVYTDTLDSLKTMS